MRRGGKAWYQSYLRSPHWRAVRAAKLAEVPACEKCAARTELQVHHLTYERIGGELPSDLQVLCDPCHGKVHAPATRKRRKRKPQVVKPKTPTVLLSDPNPGGRVKKDHSDGLREQRRKAKERRERLADLKTWR